MSHCLGRRCRILLGVLELLGKHRAGSLVGGIRVCLRSRNWISRIWLLVCKGIRGRLFFLRIISALIYLLYC